MIINRSIFCAKNKKFLKTSFLPCKLTLSRLLHKLLIINKYDLNIQNLKPTFRTILYKYLIYKKL